MTGRNHKRIQYLWRDEGLRRPAHMRVAPSTSTAGCGCGPSAQPRLAMDFRFADTTTGAAVHVVDARTRETLAMRVRRTCFAHEVVHVPIGLIAPAALTSTSA